MKTSTKFGIAIFIVVVLAACITLIVTYHHRTNPVFSSTKELSSEEETQYADRTGMTPEQAARTFFEACGREDWDEVAKFFPAQFLAKEPSFLDRFKANYGGLEIINLGKPFKGRVVMFKNLKYPGVFVPYAIRLKDGTVKKWQLAIRCDNPEKRWYWDGGL